MSRQYSKIKKRIRRKAYEKRRRVRARQAKSSARA